MSNPAVMKAYADITAAVAVLTDVAAGSCRDWLSADGDPLRELSEDCLDILAGAARTDAQMAGLKALSAVTIADTARETAAPETSGQALEMAVTAEVGSVLTIGDRAAGSFLAVSHALTATLPLTLAALQAGTISWQHARVMADEAATLDTAGAAALEAHFLDPDAPGTATGCPAGQMPASRFRHHARTWRERHHTESIEKRHAKSVQDRRVEYTPDQDGMAWLSAYVPGDTAVAIWNRTTAIARGLQGPAESRTLTQLRADAYATALLGGNQAGSPSQESNHGSGGNQGSGDLDNGDVDSKGDSEGNGNPEGGGNVDSNGNPEGGGACRVPTPRAQVLVTVPVFALLGSTEEPAMLDGYGPIPASMARDLVANGADSFHRVLIDPRDGAPLEIGRTSYRITKAMRQWLRLRDGKCPFPGCSNNSLDNEADHLLAWAKGGTTGISNLGQPCPKHHVLRHNGAWRPTPATRTEPPGWISPSGRRYSSEHQDWEPPHWPQQLKRKQKSQDGPGGCTDLTFTGGSPGQEDLEWLLHIRL